MKLIGVLLVALFSFSKAQAYTNLASAYSAIHFDPTIPGNQVLVMFSDAHLNLNYLEGVVVTNLNSQMVDIVNGMNPPPAKILVSGDVSTSLANVPGFVFGDWYVTNGINEMKLWKTAIQAFTNISQTNIIWIPGNHDQGALETNAEIFSSIFTNMPTYQSFDLGGIRFFMVNSGNYGEPSASEEQWLREQVANTSPTQEVVVVTHQPPINGIVTHRGIILLLRELFSNWQARWWILCGHEHARSEGVYAIGQSNVASIVVGTANTNVFSGQTHDAGFMFLCLSNGIANRIYYHFDTQDFSIAAQPDWSHPRPWNAAFEQVPGLNLLWRRLKTDYPLPEMVVTNSGNSRNWWAYPIELQWRLALDLHQNKATHFLILSSLNPQCQCSFSSDQTNWIDVLLPPNTNNIHAFPIPSQLYGLPTIYFRLKGGSDNNFIGGWGLATTGAVSKPTFPQLLPVPDQNAVAGKLFAVTNSAINPYSPPDAKKFTLVGGPSGASIDPDSGVLSWRPPISNRSTVAPVTVRVSDNGTPKFFDEQQFWIFVQASQTPQIASLLKTNGQFSMQVYADTNYAYSVLASTNLTDWTEILSTNPATYPFQVTDSSTNFSRRFYRVEIKP